jgi:DNA polymerase
MISDRQKAACDLLAFYRDAGIDVASREEPVDRFAEGPGDTREKDTSLPQLDPVAAEEGGSEQRRLRQADPIAAGAPKIAATDRPYRTERSSPPPFPPPQAEHDQGGGGLVSRPAVAPEAAVVAAREAARSAASLEELRAMLMRFDGCPLKRTATQLVFADGDPKSRLMLVGEAPGSEEDIQGLPFVGPSGKLLDRMLAAIGLDRTKVYIANVVPWRPPGNRTPTPQETAICLPFTLRQIELANPDLLVCMGNPATQTLLSLKEGISKTRGRWFKFHTGGREIRALPTFHPAYLLRQPVSKRLAWRDFLAIEKALAT